MGPCSGDVTGVTCNDVRGAAGRHALGGSQIKRILIIESVI